MRAPDIAGIDSLIQQLGDCGIFQVLMVTIVHGAVIPVAWSNTFIMYGNYNPGWICYQTPFNSSKGFAETENSSVDDDGLRVFGSHAEISGASCEEYESCSKVIYRKDASTVVTKWNLSCDKSYIVSMMLSIQLGGYTLGIFISGVLNNVIGRKPTHLIGLALHTILRIIAAFSVDWPMFAVCRFFIGLTTGSIGVSNFMYPMEFVTSKWRALVTSIPISSLGSTLFVLLAMAVRDWRILHLLTAVVTFVFLIPAIWVPESIRWLAWKGYTDKAICVTQKIAKWNKKKTTNVDAINSIAQHEQTLEREATRSTGFDLYRREFLKITVVASYFWVCIVVCFTVVMFDIKSLSRKFYLNLTLFNLIPTVSLPLLPFMANNLGRKLSSLILIGLSCLCCASLLILDVVSGALHHGIARVVLSLLFMALVDTMWGLVMLYVVELYPTSLRSLGYSHANCLSRIGGMVAAFMVPYDATTTFIAHVVMTCLLVVNWGSISLLPETKGRHLEDYVQLEH